MSGDRDLTAEGWRQVARIRDRDITPNERFWPEAIRLASWDLDPAPTLERVQKLRILFRPACNGSQRGGRVTSIEVECRPQQAPLQACKHFPVKSGTS